MGYPSLGSLVSYNNTFFDVMYELDFDSVCIILWDQLSTRVAFLLTYARLPRVRGTIIGLLLSLLVDGQLWWLFKRVIQMRSRPGDLR